MQGVTCTALCYLYGALQSVRSFQEFKKTIQMKPVLLRLIAAALLPLTATAWAEGPAAGPSSKVVTKETFALPFLKPKVTLRDTPAP